MSGITTQQKDQRRVFLPGQYLFSYLLLNFTNSLGPDQAQVDAGSKPTHQPDHGITDTGPMPTRPKFIRQLGPNSEDNLAH